MDNIIIVKNLEKSFKETKAVQGIDFTVKKGEVFAFLGPNGAGKSTTIKMLTTLLTPDKGQILLNGFDVRREQYQARASFGVVFQDPSVDTELTAYENMELHAYLYGVDKKDLGPKIEELMRMVELWDKKDTVMKFFSGGMKRRLEIARGLIHHPKVLFLDEPTVGLDPQTRNQIWDYIKKLNRQEGVTLFFTTHYMDEVERIADRVAIMDYGKIIVQGTVGEIVSSSRAKDLEEAFIKLTGRRIREDLVKNENALIGRIHGGR